MHLHAKQWGTLVCFIFKEKYRDFQYSFIDAQTHSHQIVWCFWSHCWVLGSLKSRAWWETRDQDMFISAITGTFQNKMFLFHPYNYSDTTNSIYYFFIADSRKHSVYLVQWYTCLKKWYAYHQWHAYHQCCCLHVSRQTVVSSQSPSQQCVFMWF